MIVCASVIVIVAKKIEKRRKRRRRNIFILIFLRFLNFFFSVVSFYLFFSVFAYLFFLFFFIIIFHSLYLLKNYSSATDAHTRARALCPMFIYFPIENQRCSIERDHKGFVISQIETNPSLGAAVVVTVMDHHPATPSCRTNVAVTFLPSLHGITPI